MIIIIGVIVWLLCGLLAVYWTIKDDPEGAKIDIRCDMWDFIKFCIFLITGGFASLLAVWLIKVKVNENLEKILIKIVDKIEN